MYKHLCIEGIFFNGSYIECISKVGNMHIESIDICTGRRYKAPINVLCM